MLKKNYSKAGRSCRVTFKLPAEVDSKSAYLCGDFNDWNETVNPMKVLKNGSFSLTLSLEPERSYRFRYLLDDGRWENDWEADAYAPNEFDSEDSVVSV